MLIYINFSFDFLGLDKWKFILNITSPMNSYKMSRFFKPFKALVVVFYQI
jgi:hypothetical protein